MGKGAELSDAVFASPSKFALLDKISSFLHVIEFSEHKSFYYIGNSRVQQTKQINCQAVFNYQKNFQT